MPGWGEVAQAFYGTWRFALLDRGAMRWFDLSHRGVWRSFWSAAICYPGFILLLLLRLDAQTVAQAGLFQIFLVETIGYVIAWTAFPLLIFGLCRKIGREERGFDFIVAYNWSQILQTLAFLVLALVVDRLLPAETGSLFNLAGYFAILAYEWFIAVVAIGAGGWVAAGVVLIDVVLGSILFTIAAMLY